MPEPIKPISMVEIMAQFTDANARLDSAIGQPDALDQFVRDENPKHDSDGDDDTAGDVAREDRE